MGYYRAGFCVKGIDVAFQPHYPFEFHQADALAFPLEGFDAIHASPPCQGYIQRNKNLETKWPRLIEPVRERVRRLPYVIENVPGAPLIGPVTLCGTMFGLLTLRHRLFETNWPITVGMACDHWGTVADGDFAAVYAFGGKGRRHGRNEAGERVRDPGSKPGPEWSVALGIDWMARKELSQAIPPAYTEFVGKRLIRHLGGQAARSTSSL